MPGCGAGKGKAARQPVGSCGACVLRVLCQIAQPVASCGRFRAGCSVGPLKCPLRAFGVWTYFYIALARKRSNWGPLAGRFSCRGAAAADRRAGRTGERPRCGVWWDLVSACAKPRKRPIFKALRGYGRDKISVVSGQNLGSFCRADRAGRDKNSIVRGQKFDSPAGIKKARPAPLWGKPGLIVGPAVFQRSRCRSAGRAAAAGAPV